MAGMDLTHVLILVLGAFSATVAAYLMTFIP